MRVFQLLLRVGKLLLCIGQLLLLFIQRFTRVGERLLGLFIEAIAAPISRALGKLRDPRLSSVNAGGIRIGIDLTLPVSQPQIERRLIIQRKRLRQNVHKRRKRSAADGGAAAFIIDV